VPLLRICNPSSFLQFYASFLISPVTSLTDRTTYSSPTLHRRAVYGNSLKPNEYNRFALPSPTVVVDAITMVSTSLASKRASPQIFNPICGLTTNLHHRIAQQRLGGDTIIPYVLRMINRSMEPTHPPFLLRFLPREGVV